MTLDRRTRFAGKFFAAIFASQVAFVVVDELFGFGAPFVAEVAVSGLAFVGVYAGVNRLLVGSDRPPLLERLSGATVVYGAVLTVLMGFRCSWRFYWSNSSCPIIRGSTSGPSPALNSSSKPRSRFLA